MKKLIAGGLVLGALVNVQAYWCCGFCPAAFGIAAVGTGVALGVAATCAANQSYYSGGYYYAVPPAPVVVQQPAPAPQAPAAPAKPAPPASSMSGANNLFGR
jgi:hypothetical protein